MAQVQSSIETPWQRVYRKFGVTSQAEFARVIGKHRSKVSRALRDEKGLINGRDQEVLIEAATKQRVALTADDMTPALK